MEVLDMSNQEHRPDTEPETDAAVADAGEPDGSTDTRDVTREAGVGPSPQELDEREERLTGPRKPMGPEEPEDAPETTPDESG
jgi:hypothetical protein